MRQEAEREEKEEKNYDAEMTRGWNNKAQRAAVEFSEDPLRGGDGLSGPYE
jgi:hypothetical protein